MPVFRIALLAALASLSACAGTQLATPSGGVFAFNPGQWQPGPADLTVPQRVRK